MSWLGRECVYKSKANTHITYYILQFFSSLIVHIWIHQSENTEPMKMCSSLPVDEAELDNVRCAFHVTVVVWINDTEEYMQFSYFLL